jgi:uncharacterized membrane protein YfcA
MTAISLKGGVRRVALSCGLGIGPFAGLLGLGGAELRMPVLVSTMGLPPQRAVSVNLCVSLATLVAAAAARLSGASIDISLLCRATCTFSTGI